MKQKWKQKLPGILLGLVFLVGLGIFAYPTVADQWNKYHQSRAIASYEETGNIIATTIATAEVLTRYPSAVTKLPLSSCEIRSPNLCISDCGRSME